ncbi:DUF4251 domain-containing protein [Mucilaginibacter panaciglaebae]
MKRLLLLLFAIVSINAAYAQDQQKTYSATDIKKMADDEKFRFTAKAATLPEDANQIGASVSSDRTEDNHKTLGGGYYATLTPDSVVSYLPYFDKTKTQGTDANTTTSVAQDPSKAVATTYDYQVKQKKNGDITITIKPKGGKITKYVFNLEPNGTARLDATIDDYKIIKYDGFFTN